MKPEFKIKENKYGKFEVYYVEHKIGLFSHKEILHPFITWSGLDEVYAFNSIEIAIEELKKEVINQTERI